MVRIAPRHARKSIQLWILLIYLVLVFFLGGGARPDIQSLAILRPLAILVCCFAGFTLAKRHFVQNRVFFGLALATILLVGLQLIPLPPQLWVALPGREIIAEIDRAAQLEGVWRPISMVPHTTWNAFYSLFVPLAGALLAVQLNRDEQYQLLPVVICLGVLSGMLGLLQIASAQDGSLYFYRVTNNGAAVGLFANRNHQAIFLACLFPMLAIYASGGTSSIERARVRAAFAGAVGLALVPLLLVTGSRTGLMLGLIGLLSVPFLYRRPAAVALPSRRRRLGWAVGAIAGSGVIALALLAVLFARAEAFNRLMDSGALEDTRLDFWTPVAHMAWQYFPAGSGVGTFVEVFKLNEPGQLLQTTYLNHAHNDWLEICLTGGVFAMLLLLAALVAWFWKSWHIWRSAIAGGEEVGYGRLASVLLLMLGLASFADYPLRVPSLACLAAILAVWLERAQARSAHAD